MLKTLLFILIIFSALEIKAQCDDKFHTTSAQVFVQSGGGAGIEVGAWPSGSSKFGVFGGFMGTTKSEVFYSPSLNKTIKNSYIVPILYLKTQIKLHRFAHITASSGLMDLTKFYSSAGFRFSVPIDRGKRATTILEPQLTTMGFRTSFGIAMAFE